PPGQPVTAMKVTMLTTQAAAPGGRVRVVFRVSDLDMTPPGTKLPDGARARMKQMMASIKTELVMTERGLVESVNNDFAESVPSSARAIMGQYLGAMKASMVALPEEPVGPGATWRQPMQ